MSRFITPIKNKDVCERVRSRVSRSFGGGGKTCAITVGRKCAHASLARHPNKPIAKLMYTCVCLFYLFILLSFFFTIYTHVRFFVLYRYRPWFWFSLYVIAINAKFVIVVYLMLLVVRRVSHASCRSSFVSRIYAIHTIAVQIERLLISALSAPFSPLEIEIDNK